MISAKQKLKKVIDEQAHKWREISTFEINKVPVIVAFGK